VLGLKPRVVSILDKICRTELHPSASTDAFSCIRNTQGLRLGGQRDPCSANRDIGNGHWQEPRAAGEWVDQPSVQGLGQPSENLAVFHFWFTSYLSSHAPRPTS
jgi:hypothetical protein